MLKISTLLLTILTCSCATHDLASYNRNIQKDEWEDLYVTESRSPVSHDIDDKSVSDLKSVILEHAGSDIPTGYHLEGNVTLFKNWAMFGGDVHNQEGMNPPQWISGDTTVLLLHSMGSWKVIDAGLGHTDAFMIVWPAKYGCPDELLTQ